MALNEDIEEIDMSGICEGRVVIITGAGGGLGAAHARVLAAEGASVVVNDINEQAAAVVVEEITAAGGKAVVNTSDITNYDDSLNAVQQAIESFGGLACGGKQRRGQPRPYVCLHD